MRCLRAMGMREKCAPPPPPLLSLSLLANHPCVCSRNLICLSGLSVRRNTTFLVGGWSPGWTFEMNPMVRFGHQSRPFLLWESVATMRNLFRSTFEWRVFLPKKPKPLSIKECHYCALLGTILYYYYNAKLSPITIVFHATSKSPISLRKHASVPK